jgi:hypothetical protein
VRNTLDHCERCGQEYDKKQLRKYDSTLRGKVKLGERVKLCRKCLADKLKERISQLDCKGIVVRPMNQIGKFPVNAYQFYALDELKEYDWPLTYAEQLRSLLPAPDAVCAACGKSAKFVFCSPEVYFNNPFSEKINSAPFPKELLCGIHMISRFREQLEMGSARFDEVLPPTNSDFIRTPFQV